MSWLTHTFPFTDTDLKHMIRGHEISLELAKVRGFAQLLNDLHDNRDLRSEMETDPLSVLERRGISIPGTVIFRERSDGSWELVARVIDGSRVYTNRFATDRKNRGLFTATSQELVVA